MNSAVSLPDSLLHSQSEEQVFYYGRIELPRENLGAAVAMGMEFAEIKRMTGEIKKLTGTDHLGLASTLVRVPEMRMFLMLADGVDIAFRLYRRRGEFVLDTKQPIDRLRTNDLLAELNFCEWQIAIRQHATADDHTLKAFLHCHAGPQLSDGGEWFEAKARVQNELQSRSQLLALKPQHRLG